jgi:glutamyl-tRNA reductase
MKLALVGISHHVAPVEVRERYSLPGGLARQMLVAMRDDGGAGEALIIDTCNRTDICIAPAKAMDEREYVLGHIRRLKNLSRDDDASAVYVKSGLAAVRHLFRVSSSLDSQIIGEYQILGQVKEAYSQAVQEGSAGFLINKLMHAAFRTGKRVMTETQLGRDSVSVAQAAVDLAHQIFASLAGKTVLFIGAGETAQLAAKAVIRCGVSRIIVANRTLSRARQVAEELLPQTGEAAERGDPRAYPQHRAAGCPALVQMERELGAQGGCADAPAPPGNLAVSAITIEDIPSVLARTDLIISSTGAPGTVLTWETAHGILKDANRPLFVIDIAVPRDIDERLGKLPNVYLHNIEDLNRIVANNTDRRRQEIPMAEAIVEDEVAQFAAWLNSLALAPTIRLLVKRFELFRRDELARYGSGPAEGNGRIELLAESLCNKILHRPLSCLREMAENGTDSESMAAMELVRRMFDLESMEEDS